MLDSSFVRDDKDFAAVKKRLESRGPLGRLLEDFRKTSLLERERLRELEELRFRKKKLSEQTIKGKREGKNVEGLIEESKEIGAKIDRANQEMKELSTRARELGLDIPNIPHESVPLGKSPEDNAVERVVGRIPEFAFKPEAHWDIGTRLGILDFERASKIAGSRFAV